MEIKRNYPLKSLNTFGINVDADYFTEVASINDLREVADYITLNKTPFLVLGGGSNILFTKNFNGLVIKVAIKGIQKVSETEDEVVIKAGAGENWDDFVAYSVSAGYSGLENLSLIPGNVGASPVQNIGAYGVEMKDSFLSLEYFDFVTQRTSTFYYEDCKFGYRSSVFKTTLKGKGLVISVQYKLSKKPDFKLGYGSISEELKKMGTDKPSSQSVREAVINIRRSKLPDPEEYGNAGSFFKNPVISGAKYNQLAAQLPGMVSYPLPDGNYKLAAGWLIDHFNWKGKREGNAGVHENQALVLVNHGNARGSEIFELSEKIRKSIKDKTGIELEKEVNVY